MSHKKERDGPGNDTLVMGHKLRTSPAWPNNEAVTTYTQILTPETRNIFILR